MKNCIGVFLCFIFLCSACCKRPSENSHVNETIDCPDSALYYSRIDMITKFYNRSVDTVVHLEPDTLTKAFAKSLDYLKSVTNLKSHVYVGYVFRYLNKTDYEKDIEQYTNWYRLHCSGRNKKRK